jgi:hypothetical protein
MKVMSGESFELGWRCEFNDEGFGGSNRSDGELKMVGKQVDVGVEVWG